MAVVTWETTISTSPTTLKMEMSKNNECDMSCDPANPRRPSVPGLEGVKLATEDSTRVGTQAPVAVNATGQTKKYVQQAFHPSLFSIRPRSASLGSVLPSNNEETEVKDTQNNDEGEPQLPEWQRAPLNRNPNKKRKISNSQSPEKISTSNRFAGLPINEERQDTQPIEKKPSKPPPIILYGVEDLNKLTEFLETVAERTTFNYKIINKNQIRIISENTPVYKKLISAIREKGLIGHTFNRKEERSYRLVVRNLHHTTPHDAIKDAFEETGNKVNGEIINARFGPDKKPTSTFFVNLQPGPNNKAAKQVKIIYHQIVTIEDPKKRTSIVQCQRCQQYGHSKNYCMRPYRCVKCAESHKTKDCPKVGRSTPATCALCFGPHPSNYKGCEVYKEILARRTQRRNYERPKFIKPQLHSRNRPYSQIAGQPSTSHTTNANTVVKNDEMTTGLIENTIDQQTEQETYQQISNKRIEEIFIKQSEKINIILQQMSNMMELLKTLVVKLSK